MTKKTPTPTESVDRLFDLLETLKDAVSRLSHEHDQIREDIRDLRGALATPTAG